MHDSIRDLGRPRTLDDLIDETAVLAEDGAREGRERFVGINERGDDETRRALHERLGPKGVRKLLEQRDHGVVTEGWKGRAVASGAPTSRSTAHAKYQRDEGDPFIEGQPVNPGTGEVTVTLGRGVEDVDGSSPASVDAILAQLDARFRDDGGQSAPDGWETWTPAERMDWFRRNGMGGAKQAAAGAKRVRGAGGGDKGPRPKPLRGETTDALFEGLLREDGPKRKKPVMVSGRITVEVSAAIAGGGIAPGAIIEAFGRAMIRTGATAEQVMRSIETGCFDPDLVDALEAEESPAAETAA